MKTTREVMKEVTIMVPIDLNMKPMVLRTDPDRDLAVLCLLKYH
jgi:hypothetical protein